jgi:hypothetical protein
VASYDTQGNADQGLILTRILTGLKEI